MEQPSFGEVYSEGVGGVLRALRRLGVAEADLTDAAQDVFVVVHRRLPDFEGRSKLSTWLFGICIRVARERRRSAYQRRRVAADDALFEGLQAESDVAEEAERRQTIALLSSVIAQLPAEQRAVLTLFALDGKSGDAIAAELDIPRGTVHSRLRLAREAFRKRLHGRLDRYEARAQA